MPDSLDLSELKNEEKNQRIYQLETALQQANKQLGCIAKQQVTINKELQISFENLLNEWRQVQSTQATPLRSEDAPQTIHKVLSVLNAKSLTKGQQLKEVPDINYSITVTIGDLLPANKNHPSFTNKFYKMSTQKVQLILADDDQEDRLLFKKAVAELPFNANLVTVEDGEELMKLLADKTTEIPAVLFLDLDMPAKNGLECLTQIKQNEKLNNLHIVIFSDSADAGVLQVIHKKGAHRYIHKPSQFSKLKQVIYNAINETITPTEVDAEFLYQF